MEKKDQSSSEDEFLELSDDLVFPKSDEEKPVIPKQQFNKKRYQKKQYNKPRKYFRPKPTHQVPAKTPETQPPPSIPNNPESITADYPKDHQVFKDSEKIPEPKKKQYKKKFTPKAEAQEFQPKPLLTNSLASKANAEEFKPKNMGSQSSILKALAEDFKPSTVKISEFVPKDTAPEFKPQNIQSQLFIPNKDAAEFRPKT